MSALETQVGQIFISDKKLSKSFVSLLSEKVPETQAEIFSLVEIHGVSKGTWEEYENLAKTLQAIIRKNFRRDNGNAFENSIAQINEHLSRLAESGLTAWIGKFNACLAVRQDEQLYVATSGKIHAYLFRDKQLTDIADASETAHALKTFANFAAGKVARKDLIIFTTTQLFNYLSIERLKEILLRLPLAEACRSIAEIIRNNADQTIPFGTFVLQLGEGKDFSGESTINFSNSIEAKTIGNIAGAFAVNAKNISAGGYRLLKDNLGDRLSKENLRNYWQSFQEIKEKINPQRFRELPKAKKFFFVCALLFALLLIINLGVAVHARSVRKLAESFNQTFDDARIKINDANSAYIYGDKNKASEILAAAASELSGLQKNIQFEQKKNELINQVSALQNAINGLKTVSLNELADFKNDSLQNLKLSANKIYAFNAGTRLFAGYNLSTKKSENPFNLNVASIAALNSVDGKIYFLDDDGSAYYLNSDSNQNEKLAGKISVKPDAAAFYGSPIKIYALYRNQNAILTSPLESSAEPGAYLKESANLSNAMDLSIDGSLYLLLPDKILKFTSGLGKAFNNSGINYGPNSKIITALNFQNIYVLDSAQKRIIIMDKRGAVKAQLTAGQFQNIKDFAVDESKKIIYILSGTKLFSFGL